MKKGVFLHIIPILSAALIFLLLPNAAYAPFPDADNDTVSDDDDLCLDSLTQDVDQFGCSCAQKGCIPDDNPCTDDCELSSSGMPACNTPNNAACDGGSCEGGRCVLSTPAPCVNDGCTFQEVGQNGCEGNMKWSCVAAGNCGRRVISYCPNGCSNGECIELNTVSCTDSDGGKNYYVKGVGIQGQYQGEPIPVIFPPSTFEIPRIPPEAGARPTDNSFSLMYSDHCANENQLNEAYCDGDGLLAEEYLCPSGCVEGACAGSPQASLTVNGITATPGNPAPPMTINPSESIEISWASAGAQSWNLTYSTVNAANEHCSLGNVPPTTFGPPSENGNIMVTSEQVAQWEGCRFILNYTAFSEQNQRGISNSAIASVHVVGETTPLSDNELQASAGEYNGFFIELEDEPLVEKYEELKTTAERNNRAIGRFASSAWNVGGLLEKAATAYYSVTSTTEREVPGEINDHKDQLREKKAEFLSEAAAILQASGSSNGVTGNAVAQPSPLAAKREFSVNYNGVALAISADDAKELENVESVKRISPIYKLNITLSESTSIVGANISWLYDASGSLCRQTGRPCLTGKDVTIGIIDSGVDYTHPDLGACRRTTNINDGSCPKVIGGHDFENNDDDPMDDYGHGTHVAATAAGNGILKGIAPDAKIVAYKVGGSEAWADDVMAAFERSVDPNNDNDFSDHLDVVSMSMGDVCRRGYSLNCGPDDPLSAALDNMVRVGVVAVIAAGNSGGTSTITTPGAARKAITVGATAKDMDIADFSSRGPVNDVNGVSYTKPDVAAPGVDICAARSSILDPIVQLLSPTCLDQWHLIFSGTSMATPMVSGAVALLLQANPALTPEEVKRRLKDTANDIGADQNEQGAGLIDIAAALQLGTNCQNECSENDKRCGSEGNIMECRRGRNNCLQWKQSEPCRDDKPYCHEYRGEFACWGNLGTPKMVFGPVDSHGFVFEVGYASTLLSERFCNFYGYSFADPDMATEENPLHDGPFAVCDDFRNEMSVFGFLFCSSRPRECSTFDGEGCSVIRKLYCRDRLPPLPRGFIFIDSPNPCYVEQGQNCNVEIIWRTENALTSSIWAGAKGTSPESKICSPEPTSLRTTSCRENSCRCTVPLSPNTHEVTLYGSADNSLSNRLAGPVDIIVSTAQPPTASITVNGLRGSLFNPVRLNAGDTANFAWSSNLDSGSSTFYSLGSNCNQPSPEVPWVANSGSGEVFYDAATVAQFSGCNMAITYTARDSVDPSRTTRAVLFISGAPPAPTPPLSGSPSGSITSVTPNPCYVQPGQTCPVNIVWHAENAPRAGIRAEEPTMQWEGKICNITQTTCNVAAPPGEYYLSLKEDADNPASDNLASSNNVIPRTVKLTVSTT